MYPQKSTFVNAITPSAMENGSHNHFAKDVLVFPGNNRTGIPASFLTDF